MTDNYNLKKALDIMYKRKRYIINDLDALSKSTNYEDSEEGRIVQEIDKARRNFLIAQEQYVNADIKELLNVE